MIPNETNLLTSPLAGIMGIETAEHWRSQLKNVINPKLVVPQSHQQQQHN
jgi:hypothetical protein